MGDSGCRSREQRAERVEGGLCGGRFVVEGGGGYLHCFVLFWGGEGPGPAAVLEQIGMDSQSGLAKGREGMKEIEGSRLAKIFSNHTFVFLTLTHPPQKKKKKKKKKEKKRKMGIE